MLGVLPLFHVFAMTTVMNFGIASGMEIILLPKFELIQTLEVDRQAAAAHDAGVPTLFNAMLRHPHIGNFDLCSLEYCISGGRRAADRGEARLRGALRLQSWSKVTA